MESCKSDLDLDFPFHTDGMMMEFCFSIESAEEFKGTMEKIPDYRIREEDVRNYLN